MWYWGHVSALHSPWERSLLLIHAGKTQGVDFDPQMLDHLNAILVFYKLSMYAVLEAAFCYNLWKNADMPAVELIVFRIRVCVVARKMSLR